MDSPTLSEHAPRTLHGALPVVLAALVAPTDDPRQFRRFSMGQEMGIGLMPDRARASEEDEDGSEPSEGHPLRSRFSVLARDLSLTGLYFITKVPYRVGLQLEIQLAMGRQTLDLPSEVRRLEIPARTELGPLETQFGCGVHFLQAQLTPVTRRRLMEFLVNQQC